MLISASSYDWNKKFRGFWRSWIFYIFPRSFVCLVMWMCNIEFLQLRQSQKVASTGKHYYLVPRYPHILIDLKMVFIVLHVLLLRRHRLKNVKNGNLAKFRILKKIFLFYLSRWTLNSFYTYFFDLRLCCLPK